MDYDLKQVNCSINYQDWVKRLNECWNYIYLTKYPKEPHNINLMRNYRVFNKIENGLKGDRRTIRPTQIIEIDCVDKCNEVKTIISIIEEQYKRNHYTTNVTNLDKLEEICKDDGYKLIYRIICYLKLVELIKKKIDYDIDYYRGWSEKTWYYYFNQFNPFSWLNYIKRSLFSWENSSVERGHKKLKDFKRNELCEGKIYTTADNLLKDIKRSVREIDNINAELENLASEESKEQKCIIVSKIIDSFIYIRGNLEISRITTRNANT